MNIQISHVAHGLLAPLAGLIIILLALIGVPTGACSPDTSSGSFNDYNSYWVDSSGKVTEHSGSHVDIVYYSYDTLRAPVVTATRVM